MSLTASPSGELLTGDQVPGARAVNEPAGPHRGRDVLGSEPRDLDGEGAAQEAEVGRAAGMNGPGGATRL